MADDYEQPRRHNGRFAKDESRAERDAEAARLRHTEKLTYQQIADRLGYCDKGEAWRGVRRCTAAVRQEAGAELIAVERAELDRLYVLVDELIEQDHHAVAQGKAVYDDAGQPVYDAQPKIAAINTAIKIRESYRKLLGLDQPAKQEISGGVRYEVVGISAEDLT